MDDEERLDDVETTELEGWRQVRTVLEGLVVSLLGVTVGLAMPGAGGQVAATGSLLPAWEIVRRRAGERVESTVQDGVNRSGLTAEDFTAWVAADPQHGALLVAVVEAAARSSAEAHLDALARILAEGMHDDARIDVRTRAARALGELGPPELRVLALYDDRARHPDERTRERLHIGDLLEQLPPLAEVMDALQASLVRVGCITQNSGGMLGGGISSHHISAFGMACLEFLRRRPAESEQTPPTP